MAITIVTKVREFQIDAVTNRGSEQYYIFFDTYTSHAQMARECLGAVDPNTSTTTPSIEGQSLDSTYFPDAVVDGLNPFPRDGQNLAWQLNVSYGEIETDVESTPVGTFDKYPWQRPKSYNWSHYFDQAIMAFDKDGKPMLNSAGDRFETDVVVDRTIRTCQISFATPLSAFDPKETGDYINTINEYDITIAGSVFPKSTIKCLSYDSSVELAIVNVGQIRKEVLYNQNTVSLAYDPFTWDGVILDIGNYQNVALNNGRILDNDLLPYATPQRLNGNGLRLIQATGGIANDLGVNPDENALKLDEDRSIAGVMAFLNFQKYNKTDMNRIGF